MEVITVTSTQTNVTWVIKSRRMGWAGYVARMGKYRGTSRILVRKPEGRARLEEQGIDGRIILRWIKEIGC
jgi:hypothetical protein